MTEEKHLKKSGFLERAEYLHSGSTTIQSVKVECIKSFKFLRKSHADGVGLMLHGCVFFRSKTRGGGSVAHLIWASQQHLLNVPDPDSSPGPYLGDPRNLIANFRHRAWGGVFSSGLLLLQT